MDVTKEGVTVVDGNGKILQKPITERQHERKTQSSLYQSDRPALWSGFL
ncbi:MAG: hypothetical protein IPL32_20380 [Chloracidobacterium sp.]|nr:hypothetical protein [Chloracidobacterium sp.]